MEDEQRCRSQSTYYMLLRLHQHTIQNSSCITVLQLQYIEPQHAMFCMCHTSAMDLNPDLTCSFYSLCHKSIVSPHQASLSPLSTNRTVWCENELQFFWLDEFLVPLKSFLLPAKSYEKAAQTTKITVPPSRTTVPPYAREFVDPQLSVPTINFVTDLSGLLVQVSLVPHLYLAHLDATLAGRLPKHLSHDVELTVS